MKDFPILHFSELFHNLRRHLKKQENTFSMAGTIFPSYPAAIHRNHQKKLKTCSRPTAVSPITAGLEMNGGKTTTQHLILLACEGDAAIKPLRFGGRRKARR